jgi:hypothetical protein
VTEQRQKTKRDSTKEPRGFERTSCLGDGDLTARLGISDSNRRIRARVTCLDLRDNSA